MDLGQLQVVRMMPVRKMGKGRKETPLENEIIVRQSRDLKVAGGSRGVHVNMARLKK